MRHTSKRILTAGAVLATAVAVASGCSDKPGSSDAPATSSSSTTAAVSPQKAEVNQLLDQGTAQAQRGDIDGAVKSFNDVLARDPKNAVAYYDLGLIAQHRGDARGAISFYDKSIEVDPNQTSAMYNKAILLEEPDVNQAQALYSRVISINPKASTAFLRLGYLLDRKGDLPGAKQNYDRATQLDPQLAPLTSSVPAPGK